MSRAVNKRSKFAELRALRQSGKKKFDTYEVDDVQDLYEEVDENQYKKIVRDRLNQDDFVVDDNGEGYADDGREEWDRVPMYETESEDETAVRGKDRKCKSGSVYLGNSLRGFGFYGTRKLTPFTRHTQPRSSMTTSRPSGMPTTGTSPSTSPREPQRPSQRPR